MSYVANQYNYATPPSSAVSLVSEEVNVVDKKYFSLFDNVLDGSYYPIDSDANLWGTSIADANGILPEPFELTVTDGITVNAFRLLGNAKYYPVDFTVKFYNGANILYVITEVGNDNPNYVHYLPKTIYQASYTIQVTRISGPGVVMLHNVYTPGYVKRLDTARVKTSGLSDMSSVLDITSTDSLRVGSNDAVAMLDVHNAVQDIAAISQQHNVEHTAHVSVSDALNERLVESTSIENHAQIVDTLKVDQIGASHIENTIDVTHDTLSVANHAQQSHVINNVDAARDECPINLYSSTISDLDNVHSVMKRPFRRIYGKVYITYTDPMLASETTISYSDVAYNSQPSQVLDSNSQTNGKFFTLYENDLSGDYVLSDEHSQVGWVSKQLSNADGTFGSNPPYLRIDFSERPIIDLRITFDDTRGALPTDFFIDYVLSDGSTIRHSVVGNDKATYLASESSASVVAVIFTITRIAKGGYPVSILEVPTLSTRLYAGYQDESNLISIDLLEELSYDDNIEALGGISANEVTVKLDNSTGEFIFNNPNSVVASSLRRNRKIVPWLGVEIIPGEIEWYTLGTFWSYKWDVPVEGLVATVVGFDTIGLLDTTDFKKHTVRINESIGQLIEYVLDDAKQQLDFIEYDIDPQLYNVVIPYAWFAYGSHTEALRKISLCYPMHIYCNRDGVICAAPQKLKLDYYYDIWSDKTNVISKNYSSLYTTLPNVINVEVKSPVISVDYEFVNDSLVFDVTTLPTRTLNFNAPYISDMRVTVQCDATVKYTYNAYSWGIELNFTGTGKVYNVTCTGTALDISNSTVISHRDESSIRLNGAISRSIESEFIQTSDLALELINRLASLSEYDKYDVDVTYRGDISLTINDPILLLDGVAPDNRYNIKRHELFWNGSLSGVAHLNT